jgi:hypothetical protein
MPVKRSLWPKEIINRNYLINIIHQQEVRSIPPARASETAAEKRDSANLSAGVDIVGAWGIVYGAAHEGMEGKANARVKSSLYLTADKIKI